MVITGAVIDCEYQRPTPCIFPCDMSTISQIIANALGSSKPIHHRVNRKGSFRRAIDKQTGKVKEIRVLSVLIEDPRRAIGDLIGSQHGDGMLGEFIGESRAALGVFQGGDTGGY